MKNRILLLLLLLIPFNILSAKSFARGEKTGHEADAYSVFPFERSNSISDWFEAVHKTIDYPYNAYFKGLRDVPHTNFSWGPYGHRLFFHWGFNGKPWTSQIQERVDRCGWDRQTIDLFQKKLIDEQARRNKTIMTATSETLHLGMSGQLREYTNAFASILYDTHLLGDFTTTRIEPLLNLNAVIDDIETALYRKLKGGDEALRINKLLENTKKLYPNPRMRAAKVLQLMQKEVPGLILRAQDGYFKRHLRQCGVQLKLL
ncbi:MAG: hypothetical protein NTY32_08270 [Bacteroidia bacterium]|nr:hypothetical protein [Bacteroidia bacterium]